MIAPTGDITDYLLEWGPFIFSGLIGVGAYYVHEQVRLLKLEFQALMNANLHRISVLENAAVGSSTDLRHLEQGITDVHKDLSERITLLQQELSQWEQRVVALVPGITSSERILLMMNGDVKTLREHVASIMARMTSFEKLIDKLEHM